MKKISLLLLAVISIYGCSENNTDFDASGTFEAVETIISAQANGTINAFTVEEGQVLKDNQLVGYIDSTQLYLKKVELEKQISAILSKKPNVGVQLASYETQLAKANTERNRILNLLKDGAATSKQLDDINSEIQVLKKQIEAQRSSLNITATSFNKEAAPLYIQVEQIEDQLGKCKIINKTKGTVLSKYAEVNEMASEGKALYKIADLSTIILRAYISGDQLPQLKLNQKVTVHTDDGKGGFHTTDGIVTWINNKAEFTPKTIQTRNERANLVYAIKVKVKNDGRYKIGMYGEVKL
ncbi:HlyD family efflux transporter periplasmic adaptor subunit [Flavobacterium sp.]|uniref:HlyD family secretion protein n=1 Tax=Flavobacterium sp. TaxID=239 RepID=UPI0026154F5B|nr:HlyD family efflux transporter periplasmic adaptor subunit [Flavobacterium sp.]